MGKNTFADPIFHDEAAAREWFEKARWPHGPICPKCKTAERKLSISGDAVFALATP